MTEYRNTTTGVEVEDYELECMYEDMLHECFGRVSVAGLEYDTPRVLREIDPTAYRCGFNDYVDSLLADGVIEEASE